MKKVQGAPQTVVTKQCPTISPLNTFQWNIKHTNQNVVISPPFVVSSTGKEWWLTLNINRNNKNIQFFVSTKGKITHIPDAFLQTTFELIFSGNRYSFESNFVDLKLTPQKDLITFRPITKSFEHLTSNPEKAFAVIFTYEKHTQIQPTIKPALHDPPSNQVDAFKSLHFKWTVTDPLKKPFIKKSPMFSKLMAGKLHPVQLSLSNNQNVVQLRLQTFDIDVNYVASRLRTVQMEIFYNQKKSDLGNVSFGVVPAEKMIYFKTMNISFTELSNNYKKPFDIVILINEDIPTKPASVSQKAIQTNTAPSKAENKTCVDKINPAAVDPLIGKLVFPPNPQTLSVLRAFNDLLVKQEECDVTFDCQGVRIGSHRTILNCRGSFLRDMIKSNENELVVLKKIDSETFVDVLQFIYTGHAPNLAKTAERMIGVANMFDMPELRKAAQNALIESFKAIQNAEQVNKLLDMFESVKLRPTILEFIDANLDQLLAEPLFERALKERPNVCFDLFKTIVQGI